MPAVDQRNFHQVAEGETVIDPHQRPIRARHDRAHRHVLVKGLVRGGAADQELRRIVEILRPLVGIVVLHFVIVPGHERGCLRMQALQVGIEPVLRVAIAVGRQRRRLDAFGVAAHIGRFSSMYS